MAFLLVVLKLKEKPLVYIIWKNNSLSTIGILMIKEETAIIALAIWLTVISIFILLAKSVNLEIFFVLSLIGFLIIGEFITPKYIRPNYLRYIQDILTVGIAIFVLIVMKIVMEIFAK
jgi:hypothetical protein